MSTIAFDTLKFANRLEKAGASRDLAEAIVDAQKESLAEALDTTLATKMDILRLESRIDGLDAKLEAKFDKVQWILGVLVAIAAANFAKQFF